MRVGDRVRITVQLIDAVTEEHLWAGRYERGLRDVLSLQNEIVTTIVREIELQLTPQEQARLARARPVNPDAYEAYLKGVSHWSRLTRADMDTALRYFELALQKDPSYALGYVGIGKVWIGRRQMGLAEPGEATAALRAAIAKALELDAALHEGHYMLAVQSTWGEWDWAGGEAEFARTIDLNPNHAEARGLYSHLLMIMKRPTDAMAQIEQALELDPLNPLIQALSGIDLLILRQYDDAIARFSEALKAAAGMPLAYRGLQYAFHQKKMHEDALAATRSLLRAQGFDEVEAALGLGYTEGGYSMAIRRAADAFAAQVRAQNVASFDLVSLYVFLGDTDRALEWLERAYELREPNMPYIGVLPQFDEMRGDPRFQDLMRRMNLST
jgi:tetratricopeptide (TPR) repeat protein